MKKIILLLLHSCTLFSCKKHGCTDSNATNYDSKSNYNDGSCTYSGGIVFWSDDSTDIFPKTVTLMPGTANAETKQIPYWSPYYNYYAGALFTKVPGDYAYSTDSMSGTVTILPNQTTNIKVQ